VIQPTHEQATRDRSVATLERRQAVGICIRCECRSESCLATIEIPARAYPALRLCARWHIVRAGHERQELERALFVTADYTLVEHR
jgi:hypothetical protein